MAMTDGRTNSTLITVSLPKPVRAMLSDAAARTNTPMSHLVRDALLQTLGTAEYRMQRLDDDYDWLPVL
jgi:hypothetical protein